jgi:cell division protein FtsB
VFRWFIALLLLILLGLQFRLWFGDANILYVLDLQKKIGEQVQENERLQMRNTQLEAEVSDLKKGLSAIEERARSDQGMVREGETFYQLIEPQSEATKRK